MLFFVIFLLEISYSTVSITQQLLLLLSAFPIRGRHSEFSYLLSLASRVFSPNLPICAVPLMYSFLILPILVTPNENRNIVNSATSISVSCLSVSATVSNPYNIAGLTATLYTFPFILAGTLLSQITPDILLHPFKQGLKADPWCSPTFTLNPSVTLTVLLYHPTTMNHYQTQVHTYNFIISISISLWTKCSKRMLNADKTRIIIIGTKQHYRRSSRNTFHSNYLAVLSPHQNVSNLTINFTVNVVLFPPANCSSM